MARPKIFISYRRDDAAATAGRVFDWLARQFGRDRIFLDTDKIAAGDDFPRALEERLAASDALLAVIGPQWLTIADARGPRLNQPEDYVRREIATALARGTRVIPVLVGGARMPAADELPEPLRPLAHRNAATLHDATFERDFEVLVDDILGRPRGFVRRELDRFQRLARVATWSAFAAPAIAIILALAVWMKALDAFGLDTRAASYLLWAADLFSGPAPEPPVLIAAIDAASEKRLGRAFGPKTAAEWRQDHARLIDRAASAGAAGVAFDLFLEGESPADAALAAAARRAQGESNPIRVVFGVRTIENGQPRLSPPLRSAAAWGSLCLTRRLGYTYSAPLAVLRANDASAPGGRREGDVVPADTPALALAATRTGQLQSVDVSRRQIGLAGLPPSDPPKFSAVERIHAIDGDCRTFAPGDDAAMLLIRISKPGFWREGGRQMSYADVLDRAAVPDERLQGRIVLVGVTELQDRNANRDVHDMVRGLSRTQVFGVELQADAIAELATRREITTPTAGAQALILLLLGLAGAAASFLTATLAPGARRSILGLVVASYAVVAVAAAVGGLLLNPLYDLAAFLAAYALLRRVQRRWVRRPTPEGLA